MAETTIGNLTAGAVDGTTLLEQERTVSGSQVSEKVTSSSLANFVGTSHQFAGLNTDVKTLVGAINEAAESGGASVIQLTSAEYAALTSEEKMNGSIYKLTDKAVMMCLDEEYHAVKELLSADYDALTSAQKNNGTIYIKTDEETTAEDIPIEDGSSETIAEALSDILLTQNYSVPWTVSANSRVNFSDSFVSAPTGYTAVGVVGIATNTLGCWFQAFRLGGGEWSFEIFNSTNETKSANANIIVLFAKTARL